MLVLTRTREETIMIGDDVEITIVDIRGDKVRLGINAPRDVQVHRKEVYDAIRRENAAAANVGLNDLTAVNEKMRQTTKPPHRPGSSSTGGSTSTNINGNIKRGPGA